ncbi:MAG: HD domain-containing protein [Solirubrobacterales bacterium]|nr:HD domain-containing protein [Solirubrobacterales bacterium]
MTEPPGMTADPLPALREIAGEAWLVGGAVRDRLLGRPTADFDVAVGGEPRRVARALARATRAHPFALSEGFGGWRVVAHDHRWQVDVLPVAGGAIEADLANRDFTVNAIAEPLHGGRYIDPFGGVQDLRHRRLRMVASQVFAADPLRTLRLARLACELDFEIDAATAAAARAGAPALAEVAAERVFTELKRIVACDRPLRGLDLLDALRATDVVLPELSALRGVEQSQFHHLDVHDHTRLVLAETLALERDPGHRFGEHGEAVSELLAEPLANDLTRGQALRIGALLHDIAKPQTRAVTPEGRVTFLGHDVAGAELAGAVLGRLRASQRLAVHVAALVRHHLELGFLVPEMPLGRRPIYRYLRDCDPVQVDVTVLSVADRLATRGRGSERAIARHLELARQMLAEALRWRRARPAPPVRGHELARALRLAPGPDLGWMLAELEEASFAGEIASRDEALARARELISSRRAADR